MIKWTSINEKLPSDPSPDIVYESKPYIVTDGHAVGICDFCRGNGCGNPWADWSPYGDIKREKIIDWMPLPEPF